MQRSVIADGLVYHALNRGNNRAAVFFGAADFEQFLQALRQTRQRYPFRLYAYCLMGNHFHLVLEPAPGQSVSRILQSLTVAHTWHYHKARATSGHVWQGRFKSFAVESDEHCYRVCRYVERNPLRANLVQRAEDWRWSSLWRRINGDDHPRPFLSPWPLPIPEDWVEYVNTPQTEGELEALRRSVQRSCPYGSPAWQKPMAIRLGLGHTSRPRGRPRKVSPPGEATP